MHTSCKSIHDIAAELNVPTPADQPVLAICSQFRDQLAEQRCATTMKFDRILVAIESLEIPATADVLAQAAGYSDAEAAFWSHDSWMYGGY